MNQYDSMILNTKSLIYALVVLLTLCYFNNFRELNNIFKIRTFVDIINNCYDIIIWCLIIFCAWQCLKINAYFYSYR